MKNFLEYIVFRWGRGIVGYFRIVGRISAFIFHLFAVNILIRTLFWTWKRDVEFKEGAGFDPKEWFNRHLLNFFSRIIGAFVKLVALVMFLFLEIAWISLVLAFFPIWLIAPFLSIALILYFILLIPNTLGSISDPPQLIFPTGILFFALFLIFLEIKVTKYHRISRFLVVDPENPQVDDPWFGSLCAHLLVSQDNLLESLQKGSIETVLNANRLKKPEFDLLVSFEANKQIEYYENMCWFSRKNLFSKRPITEDWFYGWTFTLNQYSSDLSHQNFARNSISNQGELENLKSILNSTEGLNIAIVGETGTGRKELVESLAYDIANRNVPPKLLGKRILEFHIEDLLAGSSLPEEKIYLLQKALFEGSNAGNILLFIPSLGTYLNTDTNEGQIGKTDVSAILLNYLENANIQIITLASPGEMNILSEKQPAVIKYLKKIQLKEPDLETCLIIMAEEGRSLEGKYNKLIVYRALKRLLEISDRYLNQPAMPQRAIDFLKETIVYLNNKDPEDHIIKETEIENYASDKIGVNIGEIQSEEKEKLANLEESMQTKIVGQTPAIKAVASALQRRRLDLSNPGRPAGCFLFLGPTGVGKTHTAEVLASLYFGGENRMARLDMSEYQGEDALIKLLGDSSGKIEGYFHKILSQNPFSLILLDELEKASKVVHQLLLQIMEEGMAKTGTGQKLNFRETIIIATSNAESMLIKNLFDGKKKQEAVQREVLSKIQEDGIFSPELLNRFDEAIMFHPVTEEDTFQIAGLSLLDLKNRLKEQNILISYSKDFQNKLANIAFSSEFGARELRRVVQKDIENGIAGDMMAGKIEKGAEFELPMEYLG